MKMKYYPVLDLNSMPMLAASNYCCSFPNASLIAWLQACGTWKLFSQYIKPKLKKLRTVSVLVMVHRQNQELSYFLTRGWLSARVLYSFAWTHFGTGCFKTWYTHTLGVIKTNKRKILYGRIHKRRFMLKVCVYIAWI